MKRILKLLKLYHPKNISTLSNKVARLEKEIAKIVKLEKDLDVLIDNPDKLWLEKNKMERMDAMINDDEYTNKLRREFHLDRYRFALEFVKGKEVADIASGTGYGSRMILEEGYALKCTGIDIDKNAIYYAQKKHNVNGSEFICSSAENIPLNTESVDIIVSFETIEHVPDESLIINEFFRLLKKGGKLIISTPNSWPLTIAPYHTKEYDLKEFRRILKSKFKIESVYNQNSGTPWEYNHMQKQGITKTTEENKDLAECFIAVCTKE